MQRDFILRAVQYIIFDQICGIQMFLRFGLRNVSTCIFGLLSGLVPLEMICVRAGIQHTGHAHDQA